MTTTQYYLSHIPEFAVLANACGNKGVKNQLKTEQDKSIKDRGHPIDRTTKALVQVENRNHSRELMIFNSVSENIRDIIDKKFHSNQKPVSAYEFDTSSEFNTDGTYKLKIKVIIKK